MRVPGFLARQLIVPGSLRPAGDGFSITVTNPIGDGRIERVVRIVVDRHAVPVEAITATRDGDPVVYRAVDVTPSTPVDFRKGDRVTFRVAGVPLAPGDHDLEVELVESQLGTLIVALTERAVAG